MRNFIQYILLLTLIGIVSYILIHYSTVLFYITGLIIQLAGIVITLHLLLFDNRGTNSKVAWIAVIIILPIVGPISYLIFGRNPYHRKFSSEQIMEREKIIRKTHSLPSYNNETSSALAEKIAHLTGIVPLNGNSVSVLTNGDATFSAIIEGLKEAKNHIHIQYYIFKMDKISTDIRDVLIEKAKSGIEVRFIYDDWGTKLNKVFLKPLLDAGAQIHAFDPVYSFWFARTVNLRNHRKMVIVDGEIAFTGGLNVGEEYRSNTNSFHFWRDTHLKIEGPAVRELQEAFVTDWVYMENKRGAADRFISEHAIEQYFTPTPIGDDWAQVIYGGPYDKERVVRDAMLELISSAKRSVYIVSPYFVPDEESLAVIRRVSMGGIIVKVIIPGKGDRGISFNGSNAYIETMLAAGAEMYAYDNESFIHAKILIVDNQKAAVGTANFDVRSFRLNHELMVFLYNDSEAMKHLISDFQNDLQRSTLLTTKDMENKSIVQRVKEQLSSLLSPIL